MAKEIKKGDYVLVAGEGCEVYKVVGLSNKGYEAVILDTGFAEAVKKCTRIPKKYHDKMYTRSHTYLNNNDILIEIYKENGEEW